MHSPNLSKGFPTLGGFADATAIFLLATFSLLILPAGARADDTDDTSQTTDEETTPLVVSATVAVNDASASEGDALTFTVTLDNAVPDGLTVTPSFSDGTATVGTDYTENTGVLSFSGTAGETQTFTVSTSEDEDVEDDETFTVSLSVSSTTHDVTATSTATGTINNDDSATVTIADASASEGDALSFTV